MLVKMNGTGTLRTKLRGVKKEMLDRQTSMIIQSMTVGSFCITNFNVKLIIGPFFL